MNKVILMGRLTKDPDVRYSAQRTAIANYSLAVPRTYKREGEPDVDFFNCVCFGKSAEFVERYLHKGMKIAIAGKLQNETYTNRDGVKVTATKVYVDEHEFCESKAATQDEATRRRQESGLSSDGFMNIPDGIDEQLPFN